MCLLRDAELNCVRTKILLMCEFRQLLIGMSIIRYLPANGTAGLLRSFVSGNRRWPRPPPMTIPITSSMYDSPLPAVIISAGQRGGIEYLPQYGPAVYFAGRPESRRLPSSLARS